MYTQQTVAVMNCDGCGKEGSPQPEADGSLGLVPGWLHYDPKYMKSLIRPVRRLDFCNIDCRDRWLYENTPLMNYEMQFNKVIISFRGKKP